MHQTGFMILLLIILTVKSLLGLEVVSTNKPAYQSSTSHSYSITPVPGFAVDGNTNPEFYSGISCCSTRGGDSDTHPWWYVDLQYIYSVSHVSIYTSNSNNHNTRVVNIQIRVGNDTVPPFSGNIKCGSTITEDMALNLNPVTMTCSQAISGRYVTLYRTVLNYDALTLCEVEVYADAETPLLNCPDDVSVGTDTGQSTATVTWSAPTVTDNLDTNLPVTCTIGSSLIGTRGSVFIIGETVVDCQATDSDGNTGSCSFSVVISDTESPVVTCPDDVGVGTDPGKPTATVTWSDPTVTDNFDTNLPVTCAIGSGLIDRPTRGSLFGIGKLNVSCQSSDNAGNTGSCSYSVVISDTEAPVVTCPDDVSVGTNPCQSIATVTWSDPIVTDNLDTNLPITCTTGSSFIGTRGSWFTIGETTVDCQSTDNAGNTGSCSFSVVISGNNASSVPGYLIAVVVILCVIILVLSPAFIIFCRGYYSLKIKVMELSTGMNITGHDIIVRKTTNAPGKDMPLPTNAAAPPTLEAQLRIDPASEDPHTYMSYMSVETTYADPKK